MVSKLIKTTWRRLRGLPAQDPRYSAPGYDRVRPGASYAPWTIDRDFLALHAAIRGHTLVDRYRCWELWTLVEQASKLSGALIEVGVWRGGSGAVIAKAAQRAGVEDPVYLCDTFRGVVKATGKDSRYRGGEHADTSRPQVESLIFERLGLGNVKILEGIFPDETADQVAEPSLRFCHIDVDVYQSAKEVLDWVWPRLVVGGIVVYDDYGFYGCDGITRFVDEQRASADRVVIHNLNGHAVVVKTG